MHIPSIRKYIVLSVIPIFTLSFFAVLYVTNNKHSHHAQTLNFEVNYENDRGDICPHLEVNDDDNRGGTCPNPTVSDDDNRGGTCPNPTVSDDDNRGGTCSNPTVSDDDNYDDMCPICCENPKYCKLPCGHEFCRKCVVRWAQECKDGVRFDTETEVDGNDVYIRNQAQSKVPECPMCRAKFCLADIQ